MKDYMSGKPSIYNQQKIPPKNQKVKVSLKLKRQPLPKRKKLLQLSKKVLKQQIQKLTINQLH